MFIFILLIRKEQQIEVWRKEIMTISSFSSTSRDKTLKKKISSIIHLPETGQIMKRETAPETPKVTGSNPQALQREAL